MRQFASVLAAAASRLLDNDGVDVSKQKHSPQHGCRCAFTMGWKQCARRMHVVAPEDCGGRVDFGTDADCFHVFLVAHLNVLFFFFFFKTSF